MVPNSDILLLIWSLFFNESSKEEWFSWTRLSNYYRMFVHLLSWNTYHIRIVDLSLDWIQNIGWNRVSTIQPRSRNVSTSSCSESENIPATLYFYHRFNIFSKVLQLGSCKFCEYLSLDSADCHKFSSLSQINTEIASFLRQPMIFILNKSQVCFQFVKDPLLTISPHTKKR